MAKLDVEKMLSLTQVKCQARWTELVPKLVEIVATSDSAGESLDALGVLSHKFMHLVPIEEFESLVLTKVIPQVEFMFGCILKSIKSRMNDSHAEFSSEFEQLRSILKFLMYFVLDCTPDTGQEIVFEYVHSLPVPVLNVVKQSFELFGECKCANLSEQLNRVFNTATLLTKSFLLLWERLKISVSAEDDVRLLVRACLMLKDVCQVYGEVTGKYPISIWKAYVNPLVKYCEVIKSRLDVGSTVCLLCDIIEQKMDEVTHLMLQTDVLRTERDSNAVQSLQICGFFSKIAITLCEKYKSHLGDCFRSLLYLTLKIYRFLPSSLLGPKLSGDVLEKAETHLGLVVETLLGRLVQEPQFLAVIMAENATLMLKNNNDFSYSRCLVQLSVLEKAFQLPAESQQLLFSGTVTLFHSFADAFSKCGVQLGLPVRCAGVMCNGKPQRSVSFYELVCPRFCGLISAVPASYFPLLERVLVEQLLSKNLWTSLLALDVWTFLGRLESPQLCFEHCCFIAEMVSLDPPASTTRRNGMPAMLMKRLFNLLANDHKLQFLHRFPLADHPGIWSHLYSCSAWSDGTYDVRHLRAVADLLLDRLNGFLHAEQKATAAELSKMSLCLQCLAQIASVPQIPPSPLGSKIMDACLLLWKSAPLRLISRDDLGEVSELMTQLLGLTGALFAVLDNQKLLQVLERIFYVQSRCSQFVTLAIFKMFHRLALKTVPADDKQARVLDTCASLLSRCLDVGGGSNAVLAHEGLETFAAYACVTQHEEVVAQCLAMKPEAIEAVKRLLNQVAVELPPKYPNALLVLQSQAKTAPPSDASSEAPQPQCSVDRSEEKGDAAEELECLESSVSRLADVLKSPPPDWMIARVKVCVERLASIIST